MPKAALDLLQPALRMTRCRTNIFVSFALLSLAGGCAHQARSIAGAIAEEVPEPFITEGLRTLSEEQTREMLVDVLGMPEIRVATRELVGSVTDGTIDALSDSSRAARLTDLSEQFVLRISTALSSVLERDIGPAMVRTLSQSLDSSLRHILSEETQNRIGMAVARVAQESTAALAMAIRDELGPALRSELGSPEMQSAIVDTSRTMSRGVVLGIQDAFEEIDARHGRTPDTILTRLQDAASTGFGLLQWGIVVLLIAFLILSGFLLRAIARAREHEAEAHRREAAIVAFTEAIKNTEGKPWSPELLDLLKESFRDSEHAVYLRDVLRRNRHLRVTRPEQNEKHEGPEGGPGTFEPAGA